MDLDDILGINKEVNQKQIKLFEEINNLKNKYPDVIDKKETFTKYVIFKHPSSSDKRIGIGFLDQDNVLPEYIRNEILTLFYQYFPKT